MQQKSTRQNHKSEHCILCIMYICLYDMDKTYKIWCARHGARGARLPLFYAQTFRNVPRSGRPGQELHILLQKRKILRIARFFQDFFGNTLDNPVGML